MTIPLIVLAGSDLEPGYLPSQQSPLTGCKAVDLQIAGRPLIETTLERLGRLDDELAPLAVAGPERLLRRVGVGVEIVDTDATFGENIAAAIEHGRSRHPGSPLAMMTCDVLPDEREMRELLADYHRHAPLDFWFPIIRAPESLDALGPSAWKPRYRLITEGGEATLALPGHLVIFDPEAMRLDFLYRLLQAGYRTRNRPVLYRRAQLIPNLITTILHQDLRELLALRLPTVTWDTLRGALVARPLRDGRLTQPVLEDNIRRVFVHRRHRRRFPRRRARLPILRGMSLAKDIDTAAEAAAIGARAAGAPGCSRER